MPDPSPLSIGTVASCPPIVVGQLDNYNILIPAAAKYVIETAGTANLNLGVWQGITGIVAVHGVGQSACHTFDAPGVYQVRVKCEVNGAGTYSFFFRPWRFSDYPVVKWFLGLFGL